MYDVIIVGGGAAGFYAAIHTAKQAPGLKVIVLEKSKNVLSKVKISGGGRCNVTHAEFSPKALVKNYPRGQKELLGPFHMHGPEAVLSFFEERGVPLKTEQDGRIFPVSNSSQSIVDCLTGAANRLGVKIIKDSGVLKFEKKENHWEITTKNKAYHAKKLLLTTGSSNKIWQQLNAIGHNIITPVPSLFTFKITDKRLENMQGISQKAEVKVFSKKSKTDHPHPKNSTEEKPILRSEGPVLITHTGLSGPGILKISAWGANVLHEYQYNFRISVNWIPEHTTHTMKQLLKNIKSIETKKTIFRTRAIDMPGMLWAKLVDAALIDKTLKWADVTKEKLDLLAKQLTDCSFIVNGKSTFKEEFVTAGGVDLKEINFKTFESKVHPGLYFAGEIINVDALTGGFNFQNAWTGAYIAAKAIAATQRTSKSGVASPFKT